MRGEHEQNDEENARRCELYSRGAYVREKTNELYWVQVILVRLLVIWGGRGDLPGKFPVYK